MALSVGPTLAACPHRISPSRRWAARRWCGWSPPTLDRDALERLADGVHARIETVEAALSRFRPGSELNAFNADSAPAVPVSPLLRRTVAAAAWAAERSGGLVDATLLGELERHGYEDSWDATAGPTSTRR